MKTKISEEKKERGRCFRFEFTLKGGCCGAYFAEFRPPPTSINFGTCGYEKASFSLLFILFAITLVISPYKLFVFPNSVYCQIHNFVGAKMLVYL